MKRIRKLLFHSSLWIGVILVLLIILEPISSISSVFAASAEYNTAEASISRGTGYSMGTGSNQTSAAPPANPTVSILPPQQSVANGATFTVDLDINTGTPIRGWQADIQFNPAEMQCTGVTEGSFLDSFAQANGGSTSAVIAPKIDNIGGRITDINYAIIGTTVTGGPYGSGTLCSISFTAQHTVNDSSIITAVNIVFSDAEANTIDEVVAYAGVVSIGKVNGTIATPPPSIITQSAGNPSPLTTTIITDDATNVTSTSATLEANLIGGNVWVEGFVLDNVSHPTTPSGEFDPVQGQGGYDLWRWFQKDDTPDPLSMSDCNDDGVVNISDVVLVGLYWGLTLPSTLYYRADVNMDDVVNITDIVLIGLYWNQTVSYGNYSSGSFQVDLSNPQYGTPLTLTGGTKYFYRAFAFGSDGWTWGNEVSFTTPYTHYFAGNYETGAYGAQASISTPSSAPSLSTTSSIASGSRRQGIQMIGLKLVGCFAMHTDITLAMHNHLQSGRPGVMMISLCMVLSLGVLIAITKLKLPEVIGTYISPAIWRFLDITSRCPHPPQPCAHTPK